MTEFEARIAAVLKRFNAPDAPLLGKGGEGWVYALGADEVLKVFIAGSRDNLDALAALHARIAVAALPFATPRILEIGAVADTWYTRERCLRGYRWHEIFGHLAPAGRRRLLDNYLAASRCLQAIEQNDLPYGQVLTLANRLTADSWPEFLLASVERVMRVSAPDLEGDVADLYGKLGAFRALVERALHESPKRLVHGDYFPGNLLVNERLEISALLDFSPHTVAGDPTMDIAGAIAFLDEKSSLAQPADVRYLRGRATAWYGADIAPLLDLYALYYSFYFSDTKLADPDTYAWCARHLNDAELWARLRE